MLNKINENLLDYVKNRKFKEINYHLSKNPHDVHDKDSKGNTIAHYAAEYGDEKIIARLFKAGASFLVENNDKQTPIDILKLSGFNQIAAKVLKSEERRSNQKEKQLELINHGLRILEIGSVETILRLQKIKINKYPVQNNSQNTNSVNEQEKAYGEKIAQKVVTPIYNNKQKTQQKSLQDSMLSASNN